MSQPLNKHKIPDRVLKQYQEIGLNPTLLQQAWDECKGNESTLLDSYQNLYTTMSYNQQIEQAEKQSYIQQQNLQKYTNNMDEEKQLNQAILESVQEAKHKQLIIEPLNPEQRIRKEGTPVGLKNLGNTCYMNPLLQIYFHNAQFTKEIMNFQPLKEEEIKGKDQNQLKNIKSCIQLVQEMQNLYGHLIGSEKMYADPSDIVKNILDENGEQYQIGNQQDIGEFNINLLARINEGLLYSRKQQVKKLSNSNNNNNNNNMEMEELVYSQNLSQNNNDDIISRITINQEENNSELTVSKSFQLNMSVETVVTQQFFGKVFIQMKYMLGDQYHQKEQEEIFNIIYLDIKQKELYYALDEYVINKIDEYKNDRGDIVQADKYNWIKKAPKTLFFQLQRVIYDKETKNLKKINDFFQIEKEIYLERFMYSQKEAYLQIYSQATISVLEENIQKIQERVDLLQQKINFLQKNISQSYNNFNKNKYYLQAIIIHDGDAQSGHYYTFIQDLQQKKWRRYNDIQVSEETEENVFKEASGGWGKASAYSLVYVTYDSAIPVENMPMRLYQFPSNEHKIVDYYYNLLSEEQQNQICVDNLKFQEEIEDYRANNQNLSKLMNNQGNVN
ncbi:ubiquitin carboxyl-terminal hydrolase family protein, putative [Ichthyophthirius multifiliis]|uniref:ubiquitinyl hydrolase 1 n=1 Tax=Ichthyophthirius multifiliis TaxID=5932 RepID=G0QUU8_ICHMU|nr:ubiquitin carboxyl-terminal hydrolase family protein, putative [Ichthyophthirius multifiliis]EGR31008.1 ubiquitin carboxyl-terminal hydrolase family protein, putative [Ichthyophthirius multifiliis]|eukprot:XP_004034494.1 ubiquitin carboxyl-terminal hydrolase family protein, putative [Ichthyophthirius multifiliis]